MSCPACGAETAPDHRYCPGCGRPNREGGPFAGGEARPKRRGRPLLLPSMPAALALLFLTALLCVAAGMLSLRRSADEAAPDYRDSAGVQPAGPSGGTGAIEPADAE